MSPQDFFERIAAEAKWSPEQREAVLLKYIAANEFDATYFAEHLADESLALKDAPPNLIIHNDGTVTDTTTNLMWMRPLLGQFIDADNNVFGSPDRMSLNHATKMAAAIDFAGYRDWRVPNINGLRTLLETGKDVDGWRMNRFVFGRDNCPMWSSSPDAQLAHSAQCICPRSGKIQAAHNSIFLTVRLARNAA